MQLEAQIRYIFIQKFHTEPLIIRSPGRINLIGEHTDYNDGFVMPAAIDKEIIYAVAPSTANNSRVYSVKYDQEYAIDISNPARTDEPKWANYLLGVLHQLNERKHKLQHFNCVFGGDVPLGAGLSSSAAMECGFAFAMNELNNLGIPKIDLVKMAQWAEHHYVGVLCGIMDQFASVMGKENHVILLDCRTVTHEYAPIDLQDYEIVLCDTKVKHSLVDSEYNTRRSECEQGVAILKKYYSNIHSLRDTDEATIRQHKTELKGKIFNRCLYVVQEIARVQLASQDLKKGDLVAFGKKMFETHEGLSHLYEVSCAELDFLVSQAKTFEGVLGSRMMGGGFGGCTINIVRKDRVAPFISELKKAYFQKFNIDMPTYEVKIKDGTSVVQKFSLAQ